MTESWAVIRLRDVVALTLLVGGLACAYGAAPSEAEPEVPAPMDEAPPPPDSTPDEAQEPEEPQEPEELRKRPESEESEIARQTGIPEDAEVKALPGQTVPAEAGKAAPTEPEDAVPAEPGEAAPAESGDAAAPVPEADTPPESPYQAIVRRNAFGLKPAPPPAPPPEPPAKEVSPSALKLSGIITMLGRRSATFVLQEPGKPQVSSDLIHEGDMDGEGGIPNLEVLQIDERAGAVRVAYGGKEMTLDFVNNGLKPPVAPAAPGAAPGRPGQGQPGANPAAAAAAAITAARSNRLRSGTAFGAPGAVPTVPDVLNPANPSGLQQIPTRPTRMSYGSSATTQVGGVGGGVISGGVGTGGGQYDGVQSGMPTLPPEQQAILMRSQEQISRQQGLPFPPSPPIPGLDPMPGPPPVPGPINN